MQYAASTLNASPTSSVNNVVTPGPRRPLVVGNWKMHGNRAFADLLMHGLRSSMVPTWPVDVAVCPPYPYLSQASTVLAGSCVQWGAQNCAEHDHGAFTGEVSAAMLAELGCTYVLVGHSERRALYGETDAQVAAKFARVIAVGMTPILCLGETLAERDAGATHTVVGRQLGAVLESSGVVAFNHAVIAYEPVWAIGTGKTATAAQAQEVHGTLRSALAQQDVGSAARVRILYGGSVKPGNAAELFSMPDIDGGLIGGASLIASDFLAIVQAAATLATH